MKLTNILLEISNSILPDTRESRSLIRELRLAVSYIFYRDKKISIDTTVSTSIREESQLLYDSGDIKKAEMKMLSATTLEQFLVFQELIEVGDFNKRVIDPYESLCDEYEYLKNRFATSDLVLSSTILRHIGNAKYYMDMNIHELKFI